MRRIFFWMLMFLLVAGAASAADLENELQTLLNRTLEENPQTPGLILYVTCPPKNLEWSGAAGTPSRESAEPLTSQYTFRTASNTKTYVAAAILRLAEMNKLSLDDSVEGYLPENWNRWLSGDGYDLHAITLRMILSHTSGLNDHSSDDRYAQAILSDTERRWLADDQIYLLTDWFDPVGKPGEKFSYSDDGYIILGRIVEKMTGMSLGPAVRSLLDFQSLGLKSTWWEIMESKPEQAGPMAHQYYSDFDTSLWNPSLDLYGGGGLISDARDLGMFTRLLLKGKVLKTGAMLGQMVGSGTAGYRLGLIGFEFDGRLGWGHTGFWNTFVVHFPTLDLTVSGCILSHHAMRGTELVGEVLEIMEN